jgi:ABC-2 type transport system ATP-binding protein
MLVAMPGVSLEIDQVRKHYGRIPALAGVSVRVEPGELFGLLGPNGAGKTTLMSIVAGLVDADGGSVRLDGGPADKAKIGLGTQDLAVYPELTARENLVFFGKLYGQNGSDLSRRVSDTLSAVGLLDRADDRVATFSGGMKRRLNLAAAVVHGPQLLLLDEPTTGVDPQSRNHIFEQVKALNAAGMTVVYTSHYMEEVQTLCPRIAILDAGKIVACDTLKNLLAAMPATATLTLDRVPPDFVARLSVVPGVDRVTASGTTVTVEAATLGPVLPSVAGACHAHGVKLLNLVATEPNLERVFLHLTGKTLRD